MAAQLAANNSEQTFPKVRGCHYLAFLEEMHISIDPDWYLEIGTQTGASLLKSSANSISVDPEFVLKHDVWSNKKQLHLFQQTSDDFFASDWLAQSGVRISMAFLDGMHLYDYLLRDFINTEKYMEPDGVIVLHDCLPWSANMAERDRSKVKGAAWTGDVWKLVPILKRYRPDLKVQIFDAAPTGLVVVSDLDPKNDTLSKNYDAITVEFDNSDDLTAYYADLDIIQSVDSPWRPESDIVREKLHFAIQTNVPRPRVQLNWGDYHFASGLRNALVRAGHTAEVRTRMHWAKVSQPGEIDLVLRGHTSFKRRPGHPLMQWSISSTEIDDVDHVFFASNELFDNSQIGEDGPSRSVLLQAFDADRVPAPVVDNVRDGIVFVGICRDGKRPLVGYALETDTQIRIWGEGWEKTPAGKYVVAPRLANTEIHAVYTSAEIVLNDHTPTMRDAGLVSNRIFDALACGAAVISDPIEGLPPEMKKFVKFADSPDTFLKAVADIRTETKAKKKARVAFALEMREKHSFDARALEIVKAAKQLNCRSQ